MAIAGNPDTVRKALTEQAEQLGLNYLLAYLFFGTMSYCSRRTPAGVRRGR